MKFWDSSAIIPLLVPEPVTQACAKWVKDDPEIIVWAFTVTEVLSGLHRKTRDGSLGESMFLEARERLLKLQRGWIELLLVEGVRQKAHRLLAVHSLTAADALQLAAALLAFEDRPEGEDFVTFDHRLAEAAKREGFHVLS